MEELIGTYGYPAVLVLSFFEGETVVVIAGFAAHRGYLSFPWVVAAAFCGTLFGDQLYFQIGRRWGDRLLDTHPALRPTAQRALALFHRYDTWFVLGFRFVYGIRTASPFVIGMSTMSAPRFFTLNAISAAIWATAIAGAGYLFGNAIEMVLGDIKRIEEYVLAALVLAGIALAVAGRLRGRRRR
ncbi:MAG: DedA family protein [Proteobacteria bacterium]|nr:DedA family protein [Pseudomonadota bacterium]